MKEYCEYCQNEQVALEFNHAIAVKRTNILGNPIAFSLRVVENGLSLDVGDTDDFLRSPIRFCPMCGRKLSWVNTTPATFDQRTQPRNFI